MPRYKFDPKTNAMLVLNEKSGRWCKQRKTKDRPIQASINVFSDIKPFLTDAAGETQLISSRSKLRAYERSNGIRQAGDFKPGEIIARQQKRREQDMQERTRLMRETRDTGGKHFTWQ